MYMRGRFSYIAGEWIILKPIYHAGQIISAYETVMGLPAAERLTGSDGTFKPEADQQRIDEVHKKALAAAELPMDWDGLTDRMRDCLLAKELAVGETVLFAATEPYGGPGDFALRGGEPAPFGGTSSPWTTSLSTMCWGAMTAAFQRNTTASHTSALCWGNTLNWRSGICVKQRPGGTPNTGSLRPQQRFRKTQCRQWEA